MNLFVIHQGENDTWDGHQGDRPDLLIPLHIPDTVYALPGGDKLNITDQIELLNSEIDSIWPNGSETLAGNVPTSAHQINLAFERPDAAGIWQGEVEIILVGGIKLSLPYTYNLMERLR